MTAAVPRDNIIRNICTESILCDVVDRKYLTSFILICRHFRILSEQICQQFGGNFPLRENFENIVRN
jgi:hypothetical protein